MKPLFTFIIGISAGLLLGLFMLGDPEPVTVPQAVERIVREEVKVEAKCPVTSPCPDRRCISPSYVLDLLKACRAGKLDQSDADITVRQ